MIYDGGKKVGSCRKVAKLVSPAKLNIGLSIVGRRPDEYHLLESLFWPISLSDEVEILPASSADDLAWSDDAPLRSLMKLPESRDNLAIRARSLVASSLPQLHSLGAIQIRKRIPLGGGLGGGSSNAGTVLRYFLAMELISASTAEQYAQSLGADVPFFLEPQPTWVSGVGEVRDLFPVTPDEKENLSFLLVLLPLPLETGEVFRRYRAMSAPFSQRKELPTSLRAYLRIATNDLEPAAISLYPLVGEVISQLKLTNCLFAGLTGSGATCFSVYEDRRSADLAAKGLQQFFRERDCKSLITTTLCVNN